MTTLATTPSQSNPETLTAREVLAHPHVVFHPYTCGLCGGIAVVAVTLIGYDDVEVASEMTTRRRRL
jgi:hypothetical protein